MKTAAVARPSARLCLVGLMTLALLPLSPTAASGSSPAIESAGIAIPRSYLVTLQPGSGMVTRIASELARAHDGHLGHVYAHALEGFSIEMDREDALALSADPRVARVEQDPVVHSVATQNNPPYGLDRIDQRDRPLSSTYTYNSTGAGSTAYIIDTGIRISHSDFGGRASHGHDFVDGDSDASDCNGHGTHVAGTVGGSTHGVAKAVSLVAVRVLDCQGSGAGADIIAGIDWVTAQHSAGENDVANMSLGTLLGTSSTIDAAVSNSIADGTTYAIAAGNGNAIGIAESACNTSPSRVPEALTVSATDSADRKASFANYGTCVDIFAPGVAIRSAWYTSDTATNTIDGTSMASPHVAGAAAQYLQANPGSSPAAVASAINGNASTGKVTSPGSGSPNRLLYNAFISGGGTPEPTPTPTPTSSPTPSPTPTGGDPDPSTPTLTNGATRSDTNGAQGTWKYYKISVPAGRPSLRVDLTGAACGLLSCNPDLDLYVAQGAKPTETSYTCRVFTGSSSGTCTVSNPASGWWYVGVHVYSGAASKSYTVRAAY
jgi:subtilisin family serine protease